MPSFSSFQNVLPDPNNSIGYAGQAAGTAGPGYASVKLSSDNRTMRTRTNSGRMISRAIAYHMWKINIGYNPMTRAEFENVYNFLIRRRGSIEPFFVSLPQYRTPQDSSFATFAASNNMEATATLAAGSTSALIDHSSLSGTPRPGDMFTISGTNSNHLKAYMVNRVETNSDYDSTAARPTSVQVRIHFTPGLAKQVENNDDFVFHNPLIKVVMTNDIQEYSLGTNGLYQFGLQLEEVQ